MKANVQSNPVKLHVPEGIVQINSGPNGTMEISIDLSGKEIELNRSLRSLHDELESQGFPPGDREAIIGAMLDGMDLQVKLIAIRSFIR